MTYRMRCAALAGLLALVAAGAGAQGEERCYGVAPAGGDQGTEGGGGPGSSTVDYQGDAWVMVPAGTCLTMALPVQPDGTPRRGALEPLDRDRP
jgi:uncharacterized membrane protein